LNDVPQMWLEVDTTNPLVQLLSAEAGRGTDLGNLSIQWSAADKNLAAQPIQILYAEQPGGEWKPVATNLENTGRHVWKVPPTVPYRFFLRIEAVDRAGNVGMAQSANPVIIDVAQPKGRLLGVSNER
jgi:hypothetical protein